MKLFTKEEMTERAVRNLEKLNCYKPYLNAYKKKGQITMYERFAGFFVNAESEPELFAKISEVENQYHGLVYAVIHDFTTFGELYTFLWQTGHPGDDKWSVQDVGGEKIVTAYVWNKTDEWNSEFGDVAIVQMLGGLVRTA